MSEPNEELVTYVATRLCQMNRFTRDMPSPEEVERARPWAFSLIVRILMDVGGQQALHAKCLQERDELRSYANSLASEHCAHLAELAEWKARARALEQRLALVSTCDSERLAVGDRVRKQHGFQFPGTLVAVFQTTAGAERCVVEAEHEDFKGMLHIYNPNQLVRR